MNLSFSYLFKSLFLLEFYICCYKQPIDFLLLSENYFLIQLNRFLIDWFSLAFTILSIFVKKKNYKQFTPLLFKTYIFNTLIFRRGTCLLNIWTTKATTWYNIGSISKLTSVNVWVWHRLKPRHVLRNTCRWTRSNCQTCHQEVIKLQPPLINDKCTKTLNLHHQHKSDGQQCIVLSAGVPRHMRD